MIKIILLILIFSSSCDDPAINGCTSPSACNFNPEATKSDGSCVQPEGCNDWCDGDNDQPAILDCLGECNGDSEYDDCGVCAGDNSTCVDCEGTANGTLIIDCNGICGGTAVIDECGVCAGGTTINEPNYLKDCYGDCLGTATIDDCGICTGGNTGYVANFLKDECGICNGDGYRENCINEDCNQMDCSGVCNKDEGYSLTNECENECENCGWKPTENCNNCESYGSCVLFGASLDTCNTCSGGISNHIADSDKDCFGVCNGSGTIDCTGTCINTSNPNAVFVEEDECGVCGGLGPIYQCGCIDIEDGKCDCDGNINDECGVCGGPGPSEGEDCDGNCTAVGANLDENGLDCLGACGGNAQYDDCGVCNGDGYTAICLGTENCNNMDCQGTCTGQPGFGAALDCTGVCLGSALYGCDGICCNGSTGVSCAEEDQCGICDSDSSNDCIQDCNNEWGGTASIDNCGTCAGGSTGVNPNQGTTPDGLYSCSDMTSLVEGGVCEDLDGDGDVDSDDCVANLCPKILWDDTDLIGFDFSFCSVPQSTIPIYVADFEITTLYLNDQFISDFSSIVNMTTLVDVNLNYNQISELPSEFCNLVENPCIISLTGNFLDCNSIPKCNNGTIVCD